MKKIFANYIGLLLLLIIVVSMVFIGLKLADYYSFAERKQLQFPSKRYHDTLCIIFLGDSWAAYHYKYNKQLTNILESKIKKPVVVHSKGAIGAKTKAIYFNMFDSISSSGTKKMIDNIPDYAIITTGINDAVAKMGIKNYRHHYNLIINFLITAGIKPIIIDIPQVDYKTVFQRETVIANLRHLISSWLTKAPLWDYEEYRKELFLLVNQDSLKTKIIYIPASTWNPKGYADPRQIYKEDHIHLNERGYKLLDSCIASYICFDLQTIHDSQ